MKNLLAFLTGEILPEDNDTEGLKQTDRWRIIFVYIPGFIAFLILFSMTFIIKEDSIKF